MTETNHLTKTSAGKRNSGIDLLRIVSTVYILIVHTINLGGILSSLNPKSTQFSVLWFINIWAVCAVNNFVMISGFAGYSDEETRTDWSKYIMLWLEVVIYGVVIAVIYKRIHPHGVSPETIRNMFFPLTNDVYWYFCAYTGVFIMKPFLDAAVRHLETSVLKKMMVIIFLFFSCFSMAANPFRLNGGYSFVWFMILYLFGASIKKLEIAEKISAWKAFAGIVILVLTAWLWKMYGFEIQIMNIRFSPGDVWTFVSPTVVAVAALHVILFSRLKFPEIIRKIISFLAPGAFSVYLINTHPCLWLNEFENRFTGWINYRTVELLLHVLFFSAAFVLAALLIDKVRQFLFKILRLRSSVQKLLYKPESKQNLG